jgi:Uncharacterized protein conserved in bacteria (DUF2169)
LRWTFHSSTDPDSDLLPSPQHALTVIAKATYSFAHCRSPEDAMELAAAPEGLALDLPSELPDSAGEEEIAYPSDFVPVKPHCDVLLHGHAHATRSDRRFAAAIEVGEVSRRFSVIGAIPTMRAPLTASAIHAEDGLAPGEHVGPKPTPPLQQVYPPGFDFSVYCSAPASQQAHTSVAGERLLLRGLSEQAEERLLRVPAVVPAAWLDTPSEVGVPVDMECDTLWIDTDREVLVMVFRGIVFIPSLDDPQIDRITIALSPMNDLPTWEEVSRDISRGAFRLAAEVSDFDDEDESALADEEAAVGLYSTWTEAPEPTVSLESYAQISAALAEGRADRAEELERHGFYEDGWMLEERGWLSRIADAATAGDTQLAARYGELFIEAQDRLAGPHEDQESMDTYVGLKVEIEASDDPLKALEERKTTFAAWMRMDRRWTRRALKDHALTAELERREQVYRERLASPSDGAREDGGA